jgi:HAD superfamily hydrolase (TIGR01509 family)
MIGRDSGARFDPTGVDAVVFDYGSTLVEFAPEQVRACDAAIAAELEARFGEHDAERFRLVRVDDRARPFQGEPPSYRESTLEELASGLVRALYDRDPDADTIDAINRARRAAFLDVVEKPAYLDHVLGTLGERYRLGVLSNYPDTDAVRGSIDRLGLSRHFATVRVSGEIGLVKPHQDAFAAVSRSMEIAPERTVYVGDNWLADVQGAKRAGMRAVHSTQFLTPEPPPRRDGDAEPDAVIAHLSELLPLLVGR